VNCAKTIQDRPGQPAYEMFGIKRRFQLCKFRPPRFKESSVGVHQIWVPPWKVQFLVLSTNLAREWLQIDTDLLRIITSTADELSGGTNIDDLEPQKYGFKWFFCYFWLQCTLKSEFSLKDTGDRPRQPAYEIKLMLSRVSWALAQISCFSFSQQKNRIIFYTVCIKYDSILAV